MYGDQWCSTQEMLAEVPEFKNDTAFGRTPVEELASYIIKGTNRVRNFLQHRYDITLYGNDLTVIPGSIRHMVAVRSGLYAINTRQMGEAGENRKAILEEEILQWERVARNGSLLDDNDVVIVNDPSIVLGDPRLLPESLEDVFSYGTRFGVRDRQLATPGGANTP